MNYKYFEQYFSSPRIQRYFLACNKDKEKAISLYYSNLKIAQAFHPLLSIIEVILRNKINNQLIDYFDDKDWIIKKKDIFMFNGNFYLKTEITKAISKVQKQQNYKQEEISNRVITELSFGFWRSCFEKNNFKTLKGQPIQIFTNRPKRFNRKTVFNRLNKIVKFRNRINHNEPICFVDNKIDFTYADDIHRKIIFLLNCIDENITKNKHFKAIDKVQDIIKEEKQKY